MEDIRVRWLQRLGGAANRRIARWCFGTRHMEALQGLAARLDDVRAAVAEGNREALREYVAAVHDHMSVEHRQWLSAAESTRAGLARLEAALSSEPPAGER